MADFSMSDMPWLGQPADPAGSLLRGVQAGAAISGARTQRAALAQRKMEFDQERSMAERNWRERMAVLPLEMTLKQQESQMNALKIEDVLKQRQLAIDNEKTIQTAWDWAGKEVNKGNLKGAFDVAFGIAGQSIGIVEDPKFKALTSHLTKLVELANQRAEIDARMPSANLGGVTVVTNPEDKTKAAFVRTGPNSLTPFPKVEDINAPQSPTGKLLADRNVAFKAGLTNDVKQYDAVLAKQAALDGFSLTTNPDGTINLTKGASQAIPTAMVTKSESQIAGAVNAIKLGSTLINRLRPEDIGLLGRGGEIVVDEGLAQIVPGVANLQRVNSRTLLKFFRSDFIKALREGDSQMSDRDRKEIEAMLPSDKANESLPSALEKIKSATKEAAERSRFSAQRANRPLPPELLKPAELIERVKKGEITWQQATEIAKMSPFRDEFDNFVETK